MQDVERNQTQSPAPRRCRGGLGRGPTSPWHCLMRVTPSARRPPPHPPAPRVPHLLPGDGRAIASPALPLPQVALTSRVTLGKVATSLHKLVCEVSSPSRNARGFHNAVESRASSRHLRACSLSNFGPVISVPSTVGTRAPFPAAFLSWVRLV